MKIGSPLVKSPLIKKVARLLPLLLLSSVLSAAKTTHREIPEQFRGTWVMNLRDCGTHTDGHVYISSNTVRGWEGSGWALSIVTRDNRELALILDFSDEGYEWLGFEHFKLSADGSRLTDISDPYESNPTVRRRCPGR